MTPALEAEPGAVAAPVPITVAALYVMPRGVYANMPGVDAWPESRDARLYAGPWPVVAHPPCARWCRLAKFVQSRGGEAVGNDRGTFASALAAVRRWGGVLEHPAWSLAWAVHGLPAPPRRGWSREFCGLEDATRNGWVCEVSQAAYGHRARKDTWLYWVGPGLPPSMDWRRPRGTMVVGSCTRRGDGSFYRRPLFERLPRAERSATPPAFRDALLALARSAR